MWVVDYQKPIIDLYAIAAMYNVKALLFVSPSEQFRLGVVPSNIVLSGIVTIVLLGVRRIYL